MDPATLSSTDLYIAAAVLGSASAVFKFAIGVGDRIWKKRGEQEEHSEGAVTQSTECRYQHRAMEGKLDSQTESLKEMVRAFQGSVNDNTLRHQIIVDKLDRIAEYAKKNDEKRDR